MDEKTRKVLAAVDQLRLYYEGKAEAPLCCPLCRVVDDGCERCPWVVLEGALPTTTWDRGPCDSGGRCPVVEKRVNPSRQWRVASIKRLKRWQRQIISGTYARRVAR